jgi:hypothetical protein
MEKNKIKQCLDCKWYFIDVNNVSICEKMNERTIGSVFIPEWCPLMSDSKDADGGGTSMKKRVSVFDGTTGEFLYENDLELVNVVGELSQGRAVEIYYDNKDPLSNYKDWGFKTDSDGFAKIAYNEQHDSCPKCNGYLTADYFESDSECAWMDVFCSRCNFKYREVFKFSHSEDFDGNLLNNKGELL